MFDGLLAFGLQSLQQGKVKDSILAFSSCVLGNMETAWFHLAMAYAQQGDHDAATLCLLHILAASSKGDGDEKSRTAQVTVQASKMNLVLCSNKLFQPHWWTSLHDPHALGLWEHALRRLSHVLYSLSTSNKEKKLICEPCPERALTVTTTSSLLLYVYGGLGIHTIRLVAALRKDLPGQRILIRQCESNRLSKLLSEAALAPLTSGSTADTVQCQVLLCTSDVNPTGNQGMDAAAVKLMEAVCLKAVEVLTPRASHNVLGLKDCPERKAVPSTAPEPQLVPPRLPAVQSGVTVAGIVCSEACTAKLSLSLLAAQIWQAATHMFQSKMLTAPVLISPVMVSIWGVMVESHDLVYMNEVDLESMSMETGLDYGVANEMLWRHYRPLQVDYHEYRCLSRPQQLMAFSSQEFLKEDPEGRSKRALDKSASVMMEAVESGRVDCLVCWMEYELSSGTSGGCGGVGLSTTSPAVVLSYAPLALCSPHYNHSDEQLGFTKAGLEVPARHSTVLSPHVWQHVHYLSLKPQVDVGQVLHFDLKVSGGDSLRVELDESCLRTSNDGTALLATLETGEDAGLRSKLEAELPEGDPLTSSDDDMEAKLKDLEAGSSNDDVEYLDFGRVPHYGLGGDIKEQVGGLAVASQYQVVSMLNDVERTRCYHLGITGAVKTLLEDYLNNGKYSQLGPDNEESSPSSSSLPCPPALVVLNVGSGTGLLSMLAAKAGAPLVIGVEPDVALAMTSCALAESNGHEDAIKVVHASARDLLVVGAKNWPSNVRVSLVVHEIFGSDPLSEQILVTMRHVKEQLALPGALFMPARFHCVAALASCRALWQVYSQPHLTYGINNESSVHEVADLPMLSWLKPIKVDMDCLLLPGLYLLSEPTTVLSFDLQTMDSTLSPTGVKETEVSLCAATPMQEYVTLEKCRKMTVHEDLHKVHSGHFDTDVQHLRPNAGISPFATTRRDASDNGRSFVLNAEEKQGISITAPPLPVHCIVSWFLADCDQGGTLSSAPALGRRAGQHWDQCIQMLPDQLQLSDQFPDSVPKRYYIRAEYGLVDRIDYTVRCEEDIAS